MKLIDNMSLKTKCYLGGLTAAGLLTPFIFYFYIFGPQSGYSLARNDQAWANFGSFIGGTLGPLLSACAFYGVWATYKVQREQLTIAKNQGILDELQRLISNQHQTIELMLQQLVYCSFPLEDTRKMTIQEYLLMFMNLKSKTNESLSPIRANNITHRLSCMDDVFPYREIKEITKILINTDEIYEEYLSCGGSSKVLKFYVKEHRLLIDCIISTTKFADDLLSLKKRQNEFV
ncbi:hypothetical protein [Aeromonas hydrophila]|uniref:hypothetical protein n=1 Tax=Aeromonas hydrophila TaxID=644 RepID=UPI0007607A8D|nr:hypothetical protein [Aeromonas hydrophila]KWR68881.1 hypothetical protein ATO50_06845 [Aeromonas hydrophila]HAU4927503.1 hypothetical protein [Aeromonas hydrophila]